MKLLCIDSNSIINRAFYGIKLLTAKDGSYTNGIYGFLSILMKLCAEISPDALAFAFDLRAPTFRHLRYDGYKAQRKGMPEELAQQMPVLKELLTALGYPIVELEGYEADDILGTFAAQANEQTHVYIATGDRDSLQLVREHVTVLLASSKMGQTQTLVCDDAYIMEKYGITPPALIQVKALMGDASDNIPGVAGVGEKTALKLIAQYDTIDAIYADLDAVETTKSVREKLAKDKDNAYMSRELATICCTVPIDTNFSAYYPKQGDKAQAYRILARLEMFSMIKRLNLSPPTEEEDTAPQAEKAPRPTYTLLQDIQALDHALQDAKELFLLPRLGSSGEVTAIAACTAHNVFVTEQADATFAQALALLFGSQAPKVTYHCKELFRHGLENGYALIDVQFDLLLAAYLLSPNALDYTLPLLAAEYNVQPHLPEGFPPMLDSLVENLLALEELTPLFQKKIEEFGQSKLLTEIEIPLAKVLCSMERIGFKVDAEGIVAYGKMLDEKIVENEKEIYSYSGEPFNINSPKQMGEVLFERLGLPTRKKTKTGFSTDVDVLESLLDKHPIVSRILEYRKLAKLKSTYVDGLLKQVESDGRIHTHFNQTDTRTGRLSSTEPNLQNIPVRTALGSQLRRFFVCDSGKTLIDADYSQIELRVLAHIANDPSMIEAFETGEDIHTNTAAQVFKLPPLFITPEMRSRAKAVNFGIVYGIGAFSLSKDIGVSVSEADKYIKDYLHSFGQVKQYMDSTIAGAKENGYVTTLFGRRRYLPELKSTNKNMQAFGQRVAMNMPIQGTAADIIKIAMVRVYNRLEAEGLQARLILQVHDELIVEAPDSEVAAAKNILADEMKKAAQLRVQMDVDINTGASWYDAK